MKVREHNLIDHNKFPFYSSFRVLKKILKFLYFFKFLQTYISTSTTTVFRASKCFWLQYSLRRQLPRNTCVPGWPGSIGGVGRDWRIPTLGGVADDGTAKALVWICLQY